MWLTKRLNWIRDHEGPVVFVADAALGAAHIIAAMGESERPLVWFEIEAHDSEDPVIVGNKLSDAVCRALGSPLFGYGMPYRYGLNVLHSHLDLLGPFTFALSGAEHCSRLAAALLELQRGTSRVVLAFAVRPKGLTWPEGTLVLGTQELKLTHREALAMAADRLASDAVLELWQATDATYEGFSIALHQALELPAPLRPTPDGFRAIPGFEPSVEPRHLLSALLARERYLEALQLAVSEAPEEVPKVLSQAGDFFWERGLHASVYNLLAKLPDDIQNSSAVLPCRLTAALILGRERDVLPAAARALRGAELPELRAVYAQGLLSAHSDVEGCLTEAERAHRELRSPRTLFAYGSALVLRDPAAGIPVLEEALELAEREGSVHSRIRVACALCSQHIRLGNYRAAVRWAEWGQALYRQGGVEQVHLRVALVNFWVLANLLSGNTAGLEILIRREAASLDQVRFELAGLTRATLGAVLLAQGQPGEALATYRQLWEQARGREGVAMLSTWLVRALLETGAVDEAMEKTEQAQILARGLPRLYAARVRLARGMAMSLAAPSESRPFLRDALDFFAKPTSADCLAQAGLYLARSCLELDDVPGAQSALKGAELGLRELAESGLRYLAGPSEAFYDVRKLLDGDRTELEFRFLGETEVLFRGSRLSLRPRFAEFLTVLALHPEGLTGDQLTLAVYGESGDLRRCRVELGRLRQLVPITSRPYRIAASVSADFLNIMRLLRQGEVKSALDLYRGPLLPRSEAPKIVEMRSFIEESLKRAVLESGDAEALWRLAECLGDDLEIWEHSLSLLNERDPRRVLAMAQINTLAADYSA